jgi:hypothetical protein
MSWIRKHIRIFPRFERQHLQIFFIDNLQLKNHVKTKVLVHNRDSWLRILHPSIFILIINHIINKTINKYIFLIYIHLSKNNEKFYINKLE